MKDMELIKAIRNKFPALDQQVYGKPLIYFDNAATSQKPEEVISLINNMMAIKNGNIHRAVHKLSSDATQLYEAGRDAVKEFINARKREEIIFTSGTTAAINLVAYTFAEKYLNKGDVVIISEAEHHSNLVPWQMACLRSGAVLKYLPVDENGEWQMDQLDKLLNDRVKMVAVSHISNVLGIVNPIKNLIDKAHSVGAIVLIDGAQGIVHQKVDVVGLDCDFYVFSGHKLYASTGIGVLYGKSSILNDLPPWMGGGDMVDTVSFEKTTYAQLPLKFEAGTPNYIGAASFKPAIDFMLDIRSNDLYDYEKNIISYLNEQFMLIDGLRVYGVGENKIPLFSFTVDGVHHSDIAQLLDKMGIAVRSGLMCAEPLINKYDKTGVVRASLAPYNTLEECEFFISALRKVIGMLR